MQFLSYFSTHCTKHLSRPSHISFSRKRPQEMVLKALEKSRQTTFTFQSPSSKQAVFHRRQSGLSSTIALGESMLAFTNHMLHLTLIICRSITYKEISCFPDCISTHPGNALVVFNRCSSQLQFSFGFEYNQKLTVKPRGSFSLRTPLTFEGHELLLCFQEKSS